MTETTLIVAVVNETDARRKGGVIGEGTIMYTMHDQSELLLQCERQDDAWTNMRDLARSRDKILSSNINMRETIEC